MQRYLLPLLTTAALLYACSGEQSTPAGDAGNMTADAGTGSTSRPDAAGPMSDPQPEPWTGTVPENPMAAYFAALSASNETYCDCYYEDEDYDDAASCKVGLNATDPSAEELLCWESAATRATSVARRFTCLAEAETALKDCIAAEGCESGCLDTYSASRDACPDSSTSDGESFNNDFNTCMVGSGGAACPEMSVVGTLGMSVFTGSTVGAGDESSGECGGYGAPDRTFSWTAPSAGDFTIDTVGSQHDTVLYVYSACADGTELGCNDDADFEGGVYQSSLTLTLTADQNIIIVVDGFHEDGYQTSAGTFQVNINASTVSDS